MKVLQQIDFHPDDFEVVNGKLRFKQATKSYTLEFTKTVIPWNNNRDLGSRQCNIRNGFGIIHLDFKKTSAGNHIATLPNDCPTPISLIETQLHDGSSVYINKNSRTVYCNGAVDTRYIVNIKGYFNV